MGTGVGNGRVLSHAAALRVVSIRNPFGSSLRTLCTLPPYPVLWFPGDGLPGSQPGPCHLARPGRLGVWRVVSLTPGCSGACLAAFTCYPLALGPPTCEPVERSTVLLAQGFTAAPRSGVVSCTPCQVLQLGCAPPGCYRGVPPVRGAPWLYRCNWQVGGYTLAGLPLERSVAHSPRCAALQRCCALPQLRAGTSLGFFGLPGGYSGCYC